jgi:uncharacterized iron-regulated membrane protein
VKKKPQTLRRSLFKLHSWLGFQLFLLLSLVLISGTLATLSHEIDWLIDADRRVSLGVDAKPVSWQDIYAAAKAQRPNDAVITMTRGPGPWFATEVRTQTPGGRPHRVFVNPYTGEVTGQGHWLNVQRLLRDLHRYLFIIPGGVGLIIVSVCALVLVGQLLTGLWITRRWLTAASRVRLHRGVRVAVGDSHRAAGIWSIGFIVLISITGLWYFTEYVMIKSGHNPEAPREETLPESLLQVQGATLPDFAIDRYVAAVKTAFPELRVTEIQLPTRINQPVTLLGRSDDWLVRDRANRVFINPIDASVIRVQKADQLTPLQYITELADPWHFGYVGGLATKLIWFICGCLLSGLAVTGAWLAWRRLRTLTTRWHWANYGAMVLVIVFMGLYIRHFSGSGLPAQEQALLTQAVGSLQITPIAGIKGQGSYTGALRFSVRCEQCRPNIKKAWLYLLIESGVNVGYPRQGDKIKQEGVAVEQSLKLTPTGPTVRVAAETIAKAAAISVSLETWNGQILSSVWRL